jgi:hypothetical protein
MNRKFTLLLMAPLLLGFNSAWADNHEDDDAAGLPDAAADEARENAQIPEAAAEGLAIAAEKTAGLPSEVTIRLMDDADSEGSEAVTADVQLPTLPDEGAEGQQGLNSAADAIAGRGSFGSDIAADALENAAGVAEDARDNVENRGRAEDLPVDVPGRPDTPDVPDVPQPPNG